jgi:uncharacterized membrane protein YidH (DUF202 family)
MKIKGVGMRSRIISIIFVILGLAFCGMAAWFAYTNFSLITAGTGIPIDAIIILLAVGMIGITMLFVATLF